MGFVGKLRYIFGSAFMFGVAPEYFALWFLWRTVTVLAPDWIYQWGDDKLYVLYQSLVLFFFESCTKVEVILYGDSEKFLQKKENVLYLGNHQSTADWMIADMIAVRANSLGHLRYVMKDTLQLIPLYGLYFYEHGCVYVKRGRFSPKKMVRSLEYLQNSSINSWFVVFPEGTRYYPSSPGGIEKSKEYAKKNELVPLKHHLVPKVKGTWLTVEKLHSKLDAVYDISVLYENSVDRNGKRVNAPQLASFLAGGCPRLHVNIRRIPISEVPKEEEALKKWMYELFQEKDELVDPFFNGKGYFKGFEAGGKVSKLDFRRTFSAFMFFAVLSLPFAFTTIGQKTYLQILVYGTLGSYGWLAIRSVC